MDQEVMFSSANENWETPKWLVEAASKLVGGKFELDVCAANKKVAKANKYIDPELNALKTEWFGRCWMNPPYGRKLLHWVRRAYEQSRKDGVVVACLLPARTDTRFFHKFCTKGEVYLIEGRVLFEQDGKPILNEKTGRPQPAPFPSMIVIFGKGRRKKITTAPFKGHEV